ncbi:MAG: DUF167 family protein [Actinomycetota bacterium]|nr:DUF167 family protein [Actinomycetota bacterium]MDD5665813.1 DUF167 family protein [Actinomycetota bacterium]
MNDAGAAISEHRYGTIIEIKVYPSSSRHGTGVVSAGRIPVFVHSAPEKGKANREALKVLSEALGIPVSRMEVIRGMTTRNKTVLARGISPEHIVRAQK